MILLRMSQAAIPSARFDVGEPMQLMLAQKEEPQLSIRPIFDAMVRSKTSTTNERLENHAYSGNSAPRLAPYVNSKLAVRSKTCRNANGRARPITSDCGPIIGLFVNMDYAAKTRSNFHHPAESPLPVQQAPSAFPPHAQRSASHRLGAHQRSRSFALSRSKAETQPQLAR